MLSNKKMLRLDIGLSIINIIKNYLNRKNFTLARYLKHFIILTLKSSFMNSSSSAARASSLKIRSSSHGNGLSRILDKALAIQQTTTKNKQCKTLIWILGGNISCSNESSDAIVFVYLVGYQTLYRIQNYCGSHSNPMETSH